MPGRGCQFQRGPRVVDLASALAAPAAALRYGRACLIAGVVLAVGCSQIERAKLFNKTGAPIVIRLMADANGDPAPGDVLVTLKPGQSRTFKGVNLRNDQLPVTAGGCTYVYALNGGEFWALRRAGLGFPIEMEIQPDFTLDLQRKASDLPGFPAPSEFGFPRRPISKTCR